MGDRVRAVLVRDGLQWSLVRLRSPIHRVVVLVQLACVLCVHRCVCVRCVLFAVRICVRDDAVAWEVHSACLCFLDVSVARLTASRPGLSGLPCRCCFFIPFVMYNNETCWKRPPGQGNYGQVGP